MLIRQGGGQFLDPGDAPSGMPIAGDTIPAKLVNASCSPSGMVVRLWIATPSGAAVLAQLAIIVERPGSTHAGYGFVYLRRGGRFIRARAWIAAGGSVVVGPEDSIIAVRVARERAIDDSAAAGRTADSAASARRKAEIDSSVAAAEAATRRAAARAEKARTDSIMRRPWPLAVRQAAVARSVLIGMTEEQARAAWGKPARVNVTVNAGGTHEQWVYGSSYLYFDNGKLTTWQGSYSP
ncbi:MAG: hypothetical protein ACREL5_05620 [Gemmatimonadales bacterium]